MTVVLIFLTAFSAIKFPHLFDQLAFAWIRFRILISASKEDLKSENAGSLKKINIWLAIPPCIPQQM